MRNFGYFISFTPVKAQFLVKKKILIKEGNKNKITLLKRKYVFNLLVTKCDQCFKLNILLLLVYSFKKVIFNNYN